jgi:tryptophanase
MDHLKKPEDLGVIVPSATQMMVRNIYHTTVEHRERILKETEYNIFSFPANMVVCDFLSDSGTSSMTDLQWSAIMRGDESYGNNGTLRF